MTAGPAAMNRRGPYLAANRPNRVENSTRNSVEGSPAIPAAGSL
jgi:hypothetical protein